MPLPFLATFAEKYFPSQYYLRFILGFSILYALRSYSQGRKTNRERDLHGRVVLLTGGFTPTGSTLLEALAKRGAHIIALSPDPIEEPHINLVVEALRETTKNRQIFVEHCDLSSTESTKSFCTKFLTGQETRLDALIFTHEYEHIGPFFASEKERADCEVKRAAASDATFLITTLLLPTLLVAPPERDIRIINVVNPFYAAAVPLFPKAPNRKGSQLVLEGFRALRSVVLTRHWQRVFDALPAAPAPDADAPSAETTISASKQQKSNIVAVSVSPGFSRADTIAPLLRAKRGPRFSPRGFILYLLMLPVLYIFAKSASSAIEPILHALFVPTPFKQKVTVGKDTKGPLEDSSPEEVLKPGALYSNCSVVLLGIKVPEAAKKKDDKDAVVDDKEYGGEELGRMVWESYEESLKARGEGVSQAGVEEKGDSKKKDN